MSEKDKKEIMEMVDIAKMLAKDDPQGLTIAKSNMDILAARCRMEQARITEGPNKSGS